MNREFFFLTLRYCVHLLHDCIRLGFCDFRHDHCQTYGMGGGGGVNEGGGGGINGSRLRGAGGGGGEWGRGRAQKMTLVENE